jgi:pyrroloquinoline quinone (PQQ) biosynthesis protein C
MTFYERLTSQTAAEREEFDAIPFIRGVQRGGATRTMYLDFLTQAYHHVKHTFPLLALTASRTHDTHYQNALLTYLNGERGHEEWILDDIQAMGGNAKAVREGAPGIACQIMVAYAYFSIEHISPYAMLGSVHVLEGRSIALAEMAARSVQNSLGHSDAAGFSYLLSHGAIDIEHVAFFQSLIDRIDDGSSQTIIIENSRIFYRLYGDIFRELGVRHPGAVHAA